MKLLAVITIICLTLNIYFKCGNHISLAQASITASSHSVEVSPSASLTPTSQPSPEPTLTLTPSPSIRPTVQPSPVPSLTPTPTIDKNKIGLSEIMACPENSSEWIELYNDHNRDIVIKNWTLHDDKQEIAKLNSTLKSKEYFSLKINSRLNNSGDSVYLKNLNEKIIDQFSYQNCKKGRTFSKINDHWFLNTLPSKNKNNISPSPTATPSSTNKPTPQPSPTNKPQKSVTSAPTAKEKQTNTSLTQAQSTDSLQSQSTQKNFKSTPPLMPTITRAPLPTITYEPQEFKIPTTIYEKKSINKKKYLAYFFLSIALLLVSTYNFYIYNKKFTANKFKISYE